MKRVEADVDAGTQLQLHCWKAAGIFVGFRCARLAVRATESGYLAYVFQRRHEGRSVRITIGSAEVLRLDEAQEIARKLQRQIEGAQDPRARKKTSVST